MSVCCYFYWDGQSGIIFLGFVALKGLKSLSAGRRINPAGIAFGFHVSHKTKMKGRYLPSSRSLSRIIIFIAAVVIFIGPLLTK